MNHSSTVRGHLDFLKLIVSGILTGLSIQHLWFWLIWIALIPFLSVLYTVPLKRAFSHGLIFGISAASVLLSWIIGATQRYSGSQTLLGIPIWIAAILYFALYPAIFSVAFSWFLHKKSNVKMFLILQIFLAGAIWILCEWVRLNLLAGIPWIKYTLGFTQAKSLYGIQLAAITGQWGISFVIIAVNLLFVHAILKKKYSTALIGLGLVLLFYGFGLVHTHLNEKEIVRPVNIAILQENLKAETKWQESTGDSLANIYFHLNRQAAQMNPDIIVWSETALPWTFRTDDDLLTRVLKITYPANAGHILGILSEADDDPSKVYNSAYYIEPDGKVTSRYDKVDLLSFIEKPLLDPSFRVPFLSEGIHHNALAGSGTKLLHTPCGNIGVLICNESLLPYRSKKAVKMGADLLVNMSNDAWFEGTHLVDHHFYYARMRAVETGKNVVVNANRGISGVIKSNGRITEKHLSNIAACFGGNVSLGTEQSFYQKSGDWMISASMLILILSLIFYGKPPQGGKKK